MGWLTDTFNNYTPAGIALNELGQPGRDAASAAGNAALAQQAQAQRTYKDVSALGQKATTAGLLSYEKDLQGADRNLARQEQLVSQIDPTILEASQQALKLLRGEQSKSLEPIQNQRSMQRQKLLNQLREQLGPGAETSTAGIQALTRFDAETNNLMSGQQQSALQLLGQTAGQFSAIRPDMVRNLSYSSQVGQIPTTLYNNQAALLQNASRPLQETAGAQYLGQTLAAQGQQNLYNQLIGGGTQLGSAYLTGGSSIPALGRTAAPQQQPVYGFGGQSA